jgi:hypothetical protein
MFMSTVVKVQTCRVCINATVMKTHIKQFTARNAILFCSHILSRRRPEWEVVLVFQVQSVLTEHGSVLYKTVFCGCIYFIDNFVVVDGI